MHGRRLAALLVAAAALCGCATRYAPSGALPDTHEVMTTPWGAWIHIEHTAANGSWLQTSGELIAVSAESLYVAPNVGVVAVARTDVRLAQAELYDAPLGAVAALTVLGTLSTISHGFYLVFTAPIWVLAGTAAGSGVSKEPIVMYPDESFGRFADLSRFPQGLPNGIGRARLASVYRMQAP